MSEQAQAAKRRGHVDGVIERIRLYFEEHARERDPSKRRGPARGDEALVVGVYGPWGCGKTRWLRTIESGILADEEQRRTAGVLTVPVLFNAWQFEREPHLIIPLLKTAEARVRAELDALVARAGSSAGWIYGELDQA